MIRSTRAVSKRMSIDDGELSCSGSMTMADTKMSKRKRKMLFLKNLDSQVEATKKKLKRELTAYISSTTGMYNALIGKIPKAIQDTLVNQFLANDGQVDDKPETEPIEILSRPSEIVDFEPMLKKRVVKGKTPAMSQALPHNDEVVPSNKLTKAVVNTSSKLKKKKTSSASSTKSTVKQAPLETPMERVQPKRMLRSNVRSSTLSNKSKKLSIQKSTPFLCGTATTTKKSTLAGNTSMAFSHAQPSTVGRKRLTTQQATATKVRKIEATPLRQQNRSNMGQFAAGSQHSRQLRVRRESPDENAAPSTESGDQSMRPCRPAERVQPSIICPLEDGNTLTLSCDTDFNSLASTLSKAAVDNLMSFRDKLDDFLSSLSKQ